MQRKTVAIVQARMSSSRLPGKVLLPLGGKPVLWHVTERAKRVRGVDQVVVATSTEESDDIIETWCKANALECYRGPLLDVLRRYRSCASWYSADIIVRFTADCPVLDPEISGQVLSIFKSGNYEYGSLGPGFPDGLDTQVSSFDALTRIDALAADLEDREHVFTLVERNLSRFLTTFLETTRPNGHLRWTLDYPEDYVFLDEVFRRLMPADPFFGSAKILSLLEECPDLLSINGHLAVPH